MNKFLKIFLVFIAIWFVASLINGVLTGACIGIFETELFGNAMGTVLLSIIFSFIFSTPLVGAVWLVTCIAQSYGKSGFALFQIVLKATLAVAFIGAMLFTNTFDKEFKKVNYALCACIIFSAMASVLLFRNKIKTNG